MIAEISQTKQLLAGTPSLTGDFTFEQMCTIHLML